MNEKTTQQVAQMLCIKTRAGLVTILDRHPHLKPARMFGTTFLWTDADIARLQAHLATAKPGRPAK